MTTLLVMYLFHHVAPVSIFHHHNTVYVWSVGAQPPPVQLNYFVTSAPKPGQPGSVFCFQVMDELLYLVNKLLTNNFLTDNF